MKTTLAILILLIMPAYALAQSPVQKGPEMQQSPIQKGPQIQQSPIQKDIYGPQQKGYGGVQVEISASTMECLQRMQFQPCQPVRNVVRVFGRGIVGRKVLREITAQIQPVGVRVGVRSHHSGGRHVRPLRCVGVHVRAICSGQPCPH